MRKFFQKPLVILILLFAVGAVLWGRPTAGGDGYYYYSIYDMFTDTGKVTTTHPEKYTKFAEWALGTRDGVNYSSVAFHGAAMMWAPFILPISVIDRVGALRGVNDYLLTTTGVSLGDGLGLLAGTVTYAVFSIYLTYLWLAKYFTKRNALVSSLAVFIAQYGLFYTFTDASYTHILVGFICAAAFYLFDRLQTARPRNYILLGLVLGLGTTVRAENLLLALPFVILLLKDKRFSQLAFCALGGALVCITMPIYAYMAYGNPFTTGYTAIGGLGSGLALTNFNLLNLLFSDIRGLFVWSPLLVFAVIGLILNWRKRQHLQHTYTVAGTILLVVIFYNFWFSWWAGGSVGQRFLLGLFPLFAFGLASFNTQLHQLLNHRLWLWRGWLTIIAISCFFAIFIGRVYTNFDRSNFVKYEVVNGGMAKVPETEQYTVFDLVGLGYREYQLTQPTEWLKLPVKLVTTPHLDGRRSLIQMASLLGRAGEVQNGSLIAIRKLKGDQIVYSFDTENNPSLIVKIMQEQKELLTVTVANQSAVNVICESDFTCQISDKIVTLNDQDEFRIHIFDAQQQEIKLSNNQIFFTEAQAKLHLN